MAVRYAVLCTLYIYSVPDATLPRWALVLLLVLLVARVELRQNVSVIGTRYGFFEGREQDR